MQTRAPAPAAISMQHVKPACYCASYLLCVYAGHLVFLHHCRCERVVMKHGLRGLAFEFECLRTEHYDAIIFLQPLSMRAYTGAAPLRPEKNS